MVNDVLDSARIESGKVELDIRTINLGHIIRDALMVTVPFISCVFYLLVSQ